VKRRHLSAFAACAVVLGVLVLAAPVSAQSGGSSLVVRRVDSTDAGKVNVVFQYDGNASDVSGIKVTENGKQISDVKPTSVLPEKLPPAVVLVIDSSVSTDKNALLSNARKAAHAFVDAAPAGTLLSVVTAGGDAALLQRITTDRALVHRAIDLITPNGDGALWEGIARAAGEFRTETVAVPSIVMFTDGNSGAGTSYDTARGAVAEVGAAVFTIGLQDNDSLGGDPKALADTTGGTFVEVTAAADINDRLSQLSPKLNGLYTFTFATKTPSGVNDLTLEVSGTRAINSYVAGSVARGARDLLFQPPAASSGIKLFQNSFGKMLAVLLVLFGAGLAAFAVITTVVRDDTGLSTVLQPYSEYTVSAAEEDDDREEQGLATSPFMQRAVELTGQLAERQGLLDKAEVALERANLPLRAAEAIFFYLAGVAVLTLLVVGVTRNIVTTLIVLAVALFAAPASLNFMAARRKRKFESQLPDMLQLLSGTLRAGYSMMQGVEAVSQEVTEPMGRELRRVVTESRLGRPLEEALDAVADRMGSNDFAWATMAIRIQREVGGNLAELLMTVAETMTQRERLRRDVKALTAEGRMSAYVLGILPVGLGLAMWSLNPDYMSLLWEDGTGQALLIGGVLLMLGGFFWMSKIIKIEI
jgi:tight adherence protein B